MSTVSIALHQGSLPDFCPITAAVHDLATAGGIDERGAIFTRREVVDFILDLVGYTSDKPLHQWRLLEPSFGDGDFLFPALDRLLTAWRASGKGGDPIDELGPCVRAVELHRATFDRTHAALVARLVGEGVHARAAKSLADRWLVHGDFLLADLPGTFDVVVGNPPYVRQELIPAVLLAEYRSRYCTVYDRADLYVPFIERSLRILGKKGVLGFICADRWMKNRYGGPLRALVADEFHLGIHVDMTDTPAFHADVVAYPAVIIIGRENTGKTRVAVRPDISVEYLKSLANDLLAKNLPAHVSAVRELTGVAVGAEPWILDSSGQMLLLRRLENDFPTIEEAGCRVGIGVATGADKAFIGPFDELDVEEDRKVPLAMTRDIQTGRVVWRGLGVVNPFKDGPGSGLVSLDEYPRLKNYLNERKDVIANRHVAKRMPAHWYRTIDRITEALTSKPKLLIPDIKGQAQIVYEEGKLYPHHNLYYITSDQWDLRALQAVLLSSVARLFVASYSTKMRGGFLRFQAQYLRRIRVPYWRNVPVALRNNLMLAAYSLDIDACDRAVCELYGLSPAEEAIIEGGIK